MIVCPAACKHQCLAVIKAVAAAGVPVVVGKVDDVQKCRVFGVIDIVAHVEENAVPELARHPVGLAADAEADTAVFIHESIYPRLRFVDILLRHFIKSIEVHCEIEVVRIPRSEDILLAEVKAGGAGYHDEHHGDEDADGGKTRSVALHAVCHRGHGDEVVRLIVIALVFLQNAAQQH